jgi:hypothetical protein
MDNFDLNINNYSVVELEELLTLGKRYNREDIDYKKDIICMKIVNDDNITFDMKSKLENFFDKASTLLKTAKSKNISEDKETLDVDGYVTKDKFSDLRMNMMNGANNRFV